VKRENLNVNVELFKAVDHWATKESDRRKTTPTSDGKTRILGKEMLEEIRFLLMFQRECASDSYFFLFWHEVGDMIKYHNNVLSTPLPYKLTLWKGYTSIRRCSRFKMFCRAQNWRRVVGLH